MLNIPCPLTNIRLEDAALPVSAPADILAVRIHVTIVCGEITRVGNLRLLNGQPFEFQSVRPSETRVSPSSWLRSQSHICSALRAMCFDDAGGREMNLLIRPQFCLFLTVSDDFYADLRDRWPLPSQSKVAEYVCAAAPARSAHERLSALGNLQLMLPVANRILARRRNIQVPVRLSTGEPAPVPLDYHSSEML